MGSRVARATFPPGFNWRAFLERPSVSVQLPRCRLLLAGITQSFEATEGLVEALLISCCNRDPVIKSYDWLEVGILLHIPESSPLLGQYLARPLVANREKEWDFSLVSLPPFRLAIK
ncbi:unnamed protein product [Fusarium graminearum]|uniref:Chromosome 1, complete genome n=1 Tax=Gibberella zeae (strain ATCC MYA-4620 / CBS 123657 / FGSC 9075 / NRRL 31084 / PH-1) TaxID=229533 RepID=I1S5N7_GIBZE|nr:hypothetical protein FGSG_12158 [Fusarium graminearum PH-1]ESU08006.1 hypothetical protein FGSG_12158 [Fusarium graminearum PH-1]CEF74867.1 unnamed protein product [Fusarium graminearum]CZS78145.1 unnamed protein product [Fusarium graminearum]|eukprot:XP_011318491.1 hypothetical protein FGSG_12158 [Fusarium graminearum PH-1]